MPDIDIDFADRTSILNKIDHIVARLDNNKKHNTGVYVTEAPHNPVDNICTINHKDADDRGYFKLDFLNVSIYKSVKDEQHLTELMERIPIWQLLEHKDFSDQVFHLNGHSELLQQLKPTSVTIGGHTGDNTSSKKKLSNEELDKHIRGSLDKANKR